MKLFAIVIAAVMMFAVNTANAGELKTGEKEMIMAQGEVSELFSNFGSIIGVKKGGEIEAAAFFTDKADEIINDGVAHDAQCQQVADVTTQLFGRMVKETTGSSNTKQEVAVMNKLVKALGKYAGARCVFLEAELAN